MVIFVTKSNMNMYCVIYFKKLEALLKKIMKIFQFSSKCQFFRLIIQIKFFPQVNEYYINAEKQITIKVQLCCNNICTFCRAFYNYLCDLN